jgi:hypothetical protein
MKRLLCAVAAIAVAGSFAFAEDAATAAKPVGTFTAWNEGIVKLYDKQGSDDATTGWGPAWDWTNGAIDQEWSFSYTGADYGFSGTLEFGFDNIGNTTDYSDTTFGTTTNAPTVSWFNTYYKFNKYVELQVGKLLVGDYRPFGTLIEGGFVKRIAAQEFGPLLQLTPIDNLSLGAFVNMGTDGFAVSDYVSHINVGASYAIPELLSVRAQYRGTANDSKANYISGGVKVIALKPATVVASFQAQADDFADTLAVRASAGGSFVQDLTTNVDVAYAANSGDSQYGAEAQAEYAIGKYAVGARVGYENVSGGGGTLLWGNSDGIKGTGGFEVYPYAAVNFDNGSSVRLGVVYTTGLVADSALIQLPLVYIWSF